MLRFLSRRRNHQQINTNSDIKSQRIPTNKNLIQCRVILLDNSDISIELSVSLDRHKYASDFQYMCTPMCPIINFFNFLIGLKIYSNISSMDKRIKRKTFLFLSLSYLLTHSLSKICENTFIQQQQRE